MTITASDLAKAGFEVTPLVWESGKACGLSGTYKIEKYPPADSNPFWLWALVPDESDPFFLWTYGTPTRSEAEAQAAAAFHHRAAVLSAIRRVRK